MNVLKAASAISNPSKFSHLHKVGIQAGSSMRNEHLIRPLLPVTSHSLPLRVFL